MKRVLIIFIILQVSYIGLGQFSIDLTAGAGGMRRNITKGILDHTIAASLGLDINYKFDSIPLELNLSPYYMSSSRYEEHYGTADYASNYFPIIIVMGGAGTSFKLGKFVEVFTSLQLGYWYSKSSHYFSYYNYLEGQKWDNFERKNSQLAIGPKLGIRMGKKNFKVIIQYEDYFLSSPAISKFGKDRCTRFSVGLYYIFKKNE